MVFVGKLWMIQVFVYKGYAIEHLYAGRLITVLSKYVSREDSGGAQVLLWWAKNPSYLSVIISWLKIWDRYSARECKDNTQGQKWQKNQRRWVCSNPSHMTCLYTICRSRCQVSEHDAVVKIKHGCLQYRHTLWNPSREHTSGAWNHKFLNIITMWGEILPRENNYWLAFQFGSYLWRR